MSATDESWTGNGLAESEFPEGHSWYSFVFTRKGSLEGRVWIGSYVPTEIIISSERAQASELLSDRGAICIACIAALLWRSCQGSQSNPDMYLLPDALAAVVIVSPTIYLAARRKFDLFIRSLSLPGPLFPAFVVGSLLLATGMTRPSFWTISGVEYHLPLTCLCGAGLCGIDLWLALPVAARRRCFVASAAVWDYRPEDILFPARCALYRGCFTTLHLRRASSAIKIHDGRDLTQPWSSFRSRYGESFMLCTPSSNEHRTFHFRSSLSCSSP